MWLACSVGSCVKSNSIRLPIPFIHFTAYSLSLFKRVFSFHYYRVLTLMYLDNILRLMYYTREVQQNLTVSPAVYVCYVFIYCHITFQNGMNNSNLLTDTSEDKVSLFNRSTFDYLLYRFLLYKGKTCNCFIRFMESLSTRFIKFCRENALRRIMSCM